MNLTSRAGVAGRTVRRRHRESSQVSSRIPDQNPTDSPRPPRAGACPPAATLCRPARNIPNF
eukprot:1186951-Prorocentrum_minimum.AAC.2